MSYKGMQYNLWQGSLPQTVPILKGINTKPFYEDELDLNEKTTMTHF